MHYLQVSLISSYLSACLTKPCSNGHMRKVYLKLIECLYSIWCSKTFTSLDVILVSSLMGKYAQAWDDPENLNIVNTKIRRVMRKRWRIVYDILIFSKQSKFTIFSFLSAISVLPSQPCLYKSQCFFSRTPV